MESKKRTKTISLLEKEVNKYVKDIRPRIERIMEASVLSLIGLEKRNSDYEIDHCNGRNSVLIDAFKSIAIGEVKKLASTYKPTKEDIIDFKEAFKKEYASQMGYAIRNLVKGKVDKDINKLLETVRVDVDSIVQSNLGEE